MWFTYSAPTRRASISVEGLQNKEQMLALKAILNLPAFSKTLNEEEVSKIEKAFCTDDAISDSGVTVLRLPNDNYRVYIRISCVDPVDKKHWKEHIEREVVEPSDLFI